MASPVSVLGDLIPLWPNAVLGSMIDTDLRLRVIRVDCYCASPPVLQHWRPKLAYRGCKSTNIFLYDMTVVDTMGKQFIMVMSPFHDSTAALLLGSTIRATSLIKLKVTGADLFYLVVADFLMDPEPETFKLRFSGELDLPGYVSQDKPLCCPLVKSLCPWTRMAVLWDVQPVKVYDSLKSLPVQFANIINFINNGTFSLKKLDESFVNQNSSKRPLALRILAKSKERILFYKNNPHKSMGAMTTLLVGDLTGHCKVVVWDDAVGSLHTRVVEGDILVLAGKYSLARYKPKTTGKYNLEPKSRNLHLSPVRVEIKLNVCDMGQVCLLDTGASLPLPRPEWNFVSVESLWKNKVMGSRVLDLCGAVLYLGRWERERCYDNETPTGQYWVRVWLTVFDHTSLDEDLQNPQTMRIPVKMYLDSERWKPMSDLVPGCPIVVTNLMFILTDGLCSHLECTNETQVFVNDEALSSRFSDNKVVQNFREVWNENSERVKNFVKTKASFGGEAHFGAKVLVTFRTGSFKSPDLSDLMRNLVYRASARVLVKGTVGLLVEKRVERTGEVMEESVVELVDLTGTTSLGDSQQNMASFNRLVDGLSQQNLKQAVAISCLFISENNTENFVPLSEKRFSIVGIVEGSCVIYCICTQHSVLEELTKLGSEPATFCLDIVRLEHSPGAVSSSQGVELVIRSLLPIQRDEPTDDSVLSNKDRTEHTLDFLEPWNAP